ncbi:unnamed protein product, partial [Pylaiella littoralis]
SSAGIFFLCIAVFSVAAVTFFRGVTEKKAVWSGSVGSAGGSIQAATQLSERKPPPSAVEIPEEEGGFSTQAPVHVTTEQCTSDTSKPAANGADVVAFRSLLPGTAAVFGTPEFSTLFGRYTFYFSTLENKLLFESAPATYLPAWGGFCSYGISKESVWNADNLGPASNPDFWLIVDGQLYLFRSATPFGKFQTDIPKHINHGNSVWNKWFDGNVDPLVTPFDTACFCSEDTCEDG